MTDRSLNKEPHIISLIFSLPVANLVEERSARRFSICNIKGMSSFQLIDLNPNQSRKLKIGISWTHDFFYIKAEKF